MTRRALCIGLNDYPTSPLYGCVNDARDWSQVLSTAFGFEAAPTLLDGDATRDRILTAIGDLLDDAGPNDLAVICYSGHGTRVPDADGDEADRLDEALVPVDYARNGFVVDDDLYRLFAPAEARGVRTVFIADSCFSGSIGRLAPPLETTVAGVADDGDELLPRYARWLPPAEWGAPIDAMSRVWDRPRSKPRRSALTLSAARDDQVAYDAWLDGRYRGAFTAAALHALARVAGETPATNYRSWFRVIRQLLPSVDFDQEPTIDGTSAQRRWRLFDEHGSR